MESMLLIIRILFFFTVFLGSNISVAGDSVKGSFGDVLKTIEGLQRSGQISVAKQEAKKLLQKAFTLNEPEQVRDILTVYTSILQDEQEEEKALENLYRLYESSRAQGAARLEAIVAGQLGEFYQDLGLLEDALKWYNQSLDLQKSHLWPQDEAEIRVMRSFVLAMQGKMDLATTELTALLAQFDQKRLNDPILLAKTHNTMGLILNRIHDYNSARQHFNEALSLAEDLNDKDLLARFTNNLASTFKNEERYDMARTLFQKALGISVETKNPKQELMAHLYLGDLDAISKRWDSCFLHYERGFDLNRRLNNKQVQGILHLKRGIAYLQSEQMKKALMDMEKARSIAESIGNRDALDQIYKHLAQIYKALGEHEKALSINEKLVNLKDTVFDSAVNTRIMAIKSRYDTGRLQRQMDRSRSVWTTLLWSLAILSGLATSFLVIIWINRNRFRRLSAGLMKQKEITIQSQLAQIKTLQQRINSYEQQSGSKIEFDNAKYKGSALSDPDCQFYLSCLVELMEKAELYLDNELSLTKLAQHMKLHPKSLSQLINAKTGKNFNEYINSFRIQEARRLLEDSDKDNMSVLEIAFDSGFNSKSTFNTLFRQTFGLSPTAYRQQRPSQIKAG